MTIYGGMHSPGFCITAAALVLTACSPPEPASPHPLVTMTIPIGVTDVNLDSLRTQIAALPFSGPGHTRKRKMQGPPVGVRVTIRPVGDSYLIDSASGPATPTIVAWIENQSEDTTTENPAFKPKNQAQYLVQVYREGADPEAKYQIIEVPTGLRGTVSVIKSGVLIPCYHTPKPHPDADFQSCDSVHTPFGVASRQRPFSFAQMSMEEPPPRTVSFVRSLMNRPSVLEDPTWIACNAGCCTLAGTQSIY